MPALPIIAGMEPFLTLRNLLARLSGAPTVANPSRRPGARERPARRSPAREVAEPSRTARQRDGDEAENLARRYLECGGLEFLAANVRYRDGEIDLVMSDGRRLQAAPTFVFVEVRRRARDSHGGAAASVTASKRRRLVAAASHYLVGLGLRTLPSCRFDVVAVTGDAASGFRVEWISDAFQDDGS